MSFLSQRWSYINSVWSKTRLKSESTSRVPYTYSITTPKIHLQSTSRLKVPFKLDTGATRNIMSTETWSKLNKPALQPATAAISATVYQLGLIYMWLGQLASFSHINRWNRPFLQGHQRGPQFVRSECFKCFKF